MRASSSNSSSRMRSLAPTQTPYGPILRQFPCRTDSSLLATLHTTSRKFPAPCSHCAASLSADFHHPNPYLLPFPLWPLVFRLCELCVEASPIPPKKF